jgi:hypothetical protein
MGMKAPKLKDLARHAEERHAARRSSFLALPDRCSSAVSVGSNDAAQTMSTEEESRGASEIKAQDDSSRREDESVGIVHAAPGVVPDPSDPHAAPGVVPDPSDPQLHHDLL